MIPRREAILKVAAGLFAEKGYNETSMAEVARISGVAQGTIFYHFKNKEELFLAVLDEIETRVIAAAGARGLVIERSEYDAVDADRLRLRGQDRLDVAAGDILDGG